MKRLALLCGALLLALQLPLPAFALSGTFSDPEGILTADQRKDVQSSIAVFADGFNLDMTVAIQDVDGSLDAAAEELYWKNEDAASEGGVILLVDPEDDEMAVASFGAASEIFNDIWIDGFLTASSDKLDQEAYYDVINDFIYQADASCRASLETASQASQAPLLSNGEVELDINQKVYDYADLLTDSEEQKLLVQAREFADMYQLDLVLVTTDDAEGKSSMAYADDFYDYNGFGIGEAHSGLLVLIDMDNRMIWLSTTGSAISLFTDGRIQEITDRAAGYLSDQDYFGGCKSAFADIQETVRTDREKSTLGGRARRSARRLPLYLLIAAAASGISIAVMARKGKTARKAVNAEGYLDRRSIELLVREDQFIRSSVSRTRIERSSGGGGGGSSTHSGSSGTSHGGGGSRF